MTMGTTTTQAYGEPAYWDNRYALDPGPFDWYQKYPSLSPLFHLYVPSHHQILVVGCGNAALSEEMANDGYNNVINIDISSVVIECMQKKYRDRPELIYIKMDVRDMNEFQSGSFDAVIDKGTLDSLMCGSNSQQNAVAMLEEVGRILKHGGVYILITYGAPIYRLSLLRSLCLWTVKLHVIEKFVAERSAEHHKWELVDPVPLNEDGSSVESVLGRNPDVHYVYVCAKDESLRPGMKH
ncbi:Methyltransferase-like protein [Thalictrum thalictroides]|uniref:Methyltransferase-like protein n=1 Tax=Thalictrum thalictroides TaxID=46969 RepID=A0A7J6W381_THATH|nr:Methyltransferase-like protein [Thalictrum thalictroides]